MSTGGQSSKLFFCPDLYNMSSNRTTVGGFDSLNTLFVFLLDFISSLQDAFNLDVVGLYNFKPLIWKWTTKNKKHKLNVHLLFIIFYYTLESTLLHYMFQDLRRWLKSSLSPIQFFTLNVSSNLSSITSCWNLHSWMNFMVSSQHLILRNQSWKTSWKWVRLLPAYYY